MSVKNLFNKGNLIQVLPATTEEEISREIESEGFIDTVLQEQERFLPQVDFSNPANWARWSSAEQSYIDTVEYIASSYPYDGSLKEKSNWQLSSSFLDLYIFENEYPRTTGYVNLGVDYGALVMSDSNYTLTDNVSYIFLKGGPNSASAGMEGKLLADTFGLSNYYSTAENRENNLEIDPTAGLTVEFWLNKPSASIGSGKQVIFDLWNSRSYADTNYGRFRLEIRPQIAGSETQFFFEMRSGSSGLTEQQADTTLSIGQNLTITGSGWQQFSLTVKNSGSQMVAQLWTSGVLNDTVVAGSSIGAITGSMIATIGALTTLVSGNFAGTGWGQLSASMDEFRYWKIARNAEQIGRYWFSQVGGGTNTDLANTNLGVYYKFNEGVWNSSTIDASDAKILDYSGRISNGNFIGYALGARSTGSAMVLGSASLAEFRDPIIYLNHPRVQEYLAEKQEIGFNHDVSGSANIYLMFPQWIREEDEENNAFTLKKLAQTIGRSFDDLHLQIESFQKIKHPTYTNSQEKPFGFVNRMVNSTGLFVPDIFGQAEAIEALANRSEIEEFENKLYEIKSRIYENIYNNLSFINKSKGTEKSFRNLFHAFGVDESLLKLNMYVDNETYEISDNVKYSIARKKFADFNDPDRFSSTVHQFATSQPNSRSFISVLSGTRFNGETYEAECLFPKKFDKSSELYFQTSFISSSIFGGHTANTGAAGTDLGWNSTDINNFQVYAVREEQESKNVYFQLTGTAGGVVPNLTSSVFKDVYDNSKWNFFVRIKPNAFPYAAATGGAGSTYTIEFIGKNYVMDVLVDSFAVSSTIPSSFLSGARRLYAGAHRTNFSGTVLAQSDVKISSVRYWVAALEDDVLDAHAKDAMNAGTLHPLRNSFMSDPNLGGNDVVQVPYIQTLGLAWDFNSVSSSSDSSDGLPTTFDATFDVPDISSGSSVYKQAIPAIREAVNYFYPGRGSFYPPNDINVVNQEYVQSAQFLPPEVQNASNLVSVLSSDDEVFTRDSRPIKSYFAVEKSFNAIISQEMLKVFGTLKSFNNLIGEPVNRYRMNYKAMEKLRNIYFSTVENSPDFDRFLEYFKWIDSSISTIIHQFIPASAFASENIRNVVESHILERNKYWTKFPTMEFRVSTPEGGLRGINERLYSAASGTAPAGQTQATNSLWWKARAERQNAGITSNNAIVDAQRNTILSATFSALQRSFSTPLRLSTEKLPDLNASLPAPSVANIKNSRAVSSSNDNSFVVNPVENFVPLRGAYEKLGNYKKDNEIISTSGRKNQNRFFIKSGGLNVVYASSQYISGASEFAVLERSSSAAKNNWVFVERFGAPGGPETNAAAGLDVEAGEYSIYNTINERNKIVRQLLNNWSRDYNLWGGSSSILINDLEAPGFHKVNRNASYKYKISATSDTEVVVSQSHDNLFIQRPLPVNDKQYSWITSSVNDAITQPFGAIPDFHRETGSLSAVAFTFLSETLSGITGSSFVGTSFNLTKSLDVANHLLTTDVSPSGELLNERILNLDGPYGFSTWRQLRVGETITARFLKRNNILSIVDAPRDFIITTENGRTEKIFARPGTFTDYKESPFSSKYKPLIHSFRMRETNKDVALEHSYTNQVSSFGSNEIINKLGYKNCEPQMYDKLKELYLDTDLADAANPISKVNKIIYSEVVWPKESNTGLARSRDRVYFSKITASFTTQSWVSTGQGSGTYAQLSNVINGIDIGLTRRQFWRDDPGKRNRKRILSASEGPGPSQIVYSTTLPNSMNFRDGLASSMWPLGKHWLKNGTLGDGTPDIHISGNDNFDWGELNKPYRFDIYNWYRNTVVTGAQDFYYSLNPTASVSFFYPGVFILPTCSAYDPTSYSFSPHGTELPMAWKVDEESGRRPFYDSYEDYAQDIRAMGKDYSQIPAFNIDGQITNYVVNQGGNFRAPTNSFLSVVGGEVSQSAPRATSGFDENFFNTFVHSDTMKRLPKISSEHKDYRFSKIRIKASGIKKLLPSQGFYPVQRTMVLASLLSASLIGNIIDPLPNRGSASLTTQVMMNPFFAPGIMYNTIKAGIAVDSLILTPPSPSTLANVFALYTSGSPNGGITVMDYANDRVRLPFESIIDLKGFPITPFKNDDVGLIRGSSSIALLPEFLSATNSPVYSVDEGRTMNAVWNGKMNSPLYSMAMNNFLAETSRFFLKGGKYKTISSKPEKDIRGKFEAGKEYLMDVVLYKQGNFAMVESHWNQDNTASYFTDASGVPIYRKSGSFSGRYFGPALKFYYDENISSDNEITSTLDYTKDPAQAPFTPPYFYGVAKATLRYLADGTELGEDTLSRVLSRMQITCTIEGMPWSGNYTPFLSYAHTLAMKITSSINLLGVSRNKIVSYNLNNINENKFQPTTATEPETTSLNTWVISPKFETPVLNIRHRPTGFYSFATGSVPTYLNGTQSVVFETSEGVVFNSASYGRSIWMNYGAIPTGSDGIFFQVQETGDAGRALRDSTVGSLAQIMGFDTTPQRVGELPDDNESSISELILAIPFVDYEIGQNNEYAGTTKIIGKNFFKIDRTIWEKQKEAVDNNRVERKTSITEMYKLLQGYVIPPELNFLLFGDIDPFVIYPLEFEHRLSRQEVADIWQNVLPDIGLIAQKEDTEFAHETGPDEFFHNKKIPEDVRWMIFKVKKKAAINYFTTTADSSDDDRFQFDFKIGRKAPEYSFNWPYDQCSLVELAKIEVGLEMEPNDLSRARQDTGIAPGQTAREQTPTLSTGITKGRQLNGKLKR